MKGGQTREAAIGMMSVEVKKKRKDKHWPKQPSSLTPIVAHDFFGPQGRPYVSPRAWRIAVTKEEDVCYALFSSYWYSSSSSS
jgi:hypothetical protein